MYSFSGLVQRGETEYLIEAEGALSVREVLFFLSCSCVLDLPCI